jgi:hypothetical protein
MQGLCLMLAEKWAFEPSKKPEQKELRTAPTIIQYVQATTCRRQLSAWYMEDDTEHGELMHSLIFARLTPQLALDCVNGLCCDNHDGAEPGKRHLDFTEFFPGPMPMLKAKGKTRKASDEPAPPKKRSVRTRPMWQRPHLEASLLTFRKTPEVRQACPRGMPVRFYLPDSHIKAIAATRRVVIRTRKGLLEAIGAAPDGVFDTRFADDMTSVINRFEFDAKLHEKQWRAMHEEKVAASKAANAAKKAAKQRRASGKADDLAHDDDNSEEGTQDEEEEQEEDEDEDDENVDDLGPSHVEEVEGERPAKQARLTICLPARSAAQ